MEFVVAACLPAACWAQVNSGSDGSDGAFNPATNTVIDMTDHPTGIYQFSSVYIPSGVAVSFLPNARNTPVVWLVQSNCLINGTVDVSGKNAQGNQAGGGGVGGWRGGGGIVGGEAGQGPGGGSASSGNRAFAAGGTYQYGNAFLVPLLGGSGGGAFSQTVGGGGGGGAILIAVSGQVVLNGAILAKGGNATYYPDPSADSAWGGGGSGGAVRLVGQTIVGTGAISVGGGIAANGGGYGRVRFDTFENGFTGGITGNFTQGSQFVVIPAAGQVPQLRIASIGGVVVGASPGGIISVPDAVLSAQQSNPIPVVVSCSNLPLHSLVTVSVKPVNGSAVSVTCYNDSGTLASSTATASVSIPRGGGITYATAATSN